MKPSTSLPVKAGIKLAVKISALGVALVTLTYFFVWSLLTALKSIMELFG
jgi:energy-converting hydrogenase Eha subunit E